MDYWWTGHPEEDIWLEITPASDREDFLRNVGGRRENQVNRSGVDLLPSLHKDHIVFHYDINRSAIVGASQVSSSDYDYQTDEADDEDWTEGYEPSVHINNFRLCEQPLSLDLMHQRQAQILDLLKKMRGAYRQRDLHLPWTSHGNSIQMSSSFLAKFPRDALSILPELVPVLDSVKYGPRDYEIVPPPQKDRRLRVPWGQLTREAVLLAIAECDELGREGFLQRYGFHPSRSYVLSHEGREYDSKAVAGVAFKHVPELNRALRLEEFSGACLPQPGDCGIWALRCMTCAPCLPMTTAPWGPIPRGTSPHFSCFRRASMS